MDSLPYVLLMTAAALICLGIAARAYQSRRKVARAASFAMMAIFGSVWMLLVLLDTLVDSLAFRQVLWSLIPFAILNTLLALFSFSLEYSLRLKRAPRGIVFSTVALNLIITGLAFTNPFHHLYWTITVVQGHFVQVMGPFFDLQLLATYVLALGSLVLLVRAYLVSAGALRLQTALMLIGILIPILVSLASDVGGWDPLPYIDAPAFSLVFTVVLFAWTTFRFNVFYLLPVASDQIIRNMQEGVLVTDVEGLVIFSNPVAQQVLGKTPDQVSGQPVAGLLAEWLPAAFQAWETGKRDVQLAADEAQNEFFRLTISQLSANSGESMGYLLTLYNISEQKNYEKRLNELAISDPLTGCYNRRYFYEMALAYFRQKQRSGRPLSILMIDLDHFKGINDTYGHARGDQVLQKVAAACKSRVRGPDIFARYGGEEFMLAMPETSLRDAVTVAERLRSAIELLSSELDGIPVTASLGVVASAGEAEVTLEDMLHRADEAMYRSKQAGRNRVTIWEAAPSLAAE